jgi:hypothetical protein
MLLASFDKLFALLVSGLTNDDGPREPISAKERLVSTLYFLGHGICQSIVCSNLIALITGVSLAVLAHNFRIGKSTLSNIVSETSQLIWDRLQSVVIKTPTTAREWQVIADRFEERWHFPHCIGALDGKHCNIQAPPHSGSLDFNHHQQFSVNLTALCHTDYNFLFVDVGAHGHCNDAGVFDTSKLGRNFANDRYDLPTPSLLPGSNHRVPYFVVGDDIYPLKQYLIKPYPGRRLTKEQRIYNGRICAARRTIENTFGQMVMKWRLLRTDVIASRENACRYFRAICCLHNFCRLEKDRQYCTGEDNDDDDGNLLQIDTGSLQHLRHNMDNHPLAAATRQRDTLCEYVNGVGAVEWQEKLYTKYY